MKRILITMLALVMLFCAACATSGNAKNKGLEGTNTSFVELNNGTDTITAAEMNGLGQSHPTVSFTKEEMNLSAYGMNYPVMVYEETATNQYKLSIVNAETKVKTEVGSISVAEDVLTINLKIEDVTQKFTFGITK